jgi:predicted permease
VASLVTGLLFGAVPAVSGSAVDPAGALRESSRGVAGGRSGLRRALVIGEVALAVTVLAGAGLLVRTVQNLMSVDAGMRADGVLTMRLNLAGERYGEESVRRTFVSELLPRLQALPGTIAAGTTSAMPLSGAKSANFFHRNDRPIPAPGEELDADYRVVGGQYFEAIGIPLIRGRVFDASDDEKAPPRFVVNEALAQRYFPGEDPIGKHITYEWYGPRSGEIVGVVGSVREMALDEEPAPAVYRPHAQDPAPTVTVVLRAAGDPLLLGRAAAGAVRAIDPALPAPRLRTVEDLMAGTLSRPRLMMYLLVGFAALSLVLVVIGLYGIVAYSVAQRTRELGIRMALGAQRSDVLRMVVGEGMALGAIGLAIGMAGALALRRLPSGLLYGVTPSDPGTFLLVASVLAATTFLASYLPASRATRINPAGVLGAEN